MWLHVRQTFTKLFSNSIKTMLHERYFTCDMCDVRFQSHEDCNNVASIEGGKYSRLYSDVCEKCAKRLVKLIDKTFPHNTRTGMKEQISAGAIPTTPRQSVQIPQE